MGPVNTKSKTHLYNTQDSHLKKQKQKKNQAPEANQFNTFFTYLHSALQELDGNPQ